MKKDIHPDYHEITVKRTDGSEFKTSSTWGKKGETLQLDIDTLNHNAWVGGKTRINEKAGNVAKFNQKFGGFSLASMSGGSKAQEAQEEKPAPAAEAEQPKEAAKAEEQSAEAAEATEAQEESKEAEAQESEESKSQE